MRKINWLYRLIILGMVSAFVCIGATHCQFVPDKVEADILQKKYGYRITKHALHRMKQRRISMVQVDQAIGQGQRYTDTKEQARVYHDPNSQVNVITKDYAIITVYRGPVKSRWEES